MVAGDLDGDGEVEVVTARNVNENDVHYTCTVSAYKLDGAMLWHWGGPGAGRGELGHDVPCQIHDWDGDGRAEVVVCDQRELVALDGATGRELRRLPLPGRGITDCVTFCNLSGGDRPTDVLVKSRYTQVFAFDRDWRLLWSVDHPGGHRTAHQPFVVDIDHDGRDEVMVGYVLLNSDGSERWRIQGHEAVLEKGHLDCCRLLRDADDPDEQRLAFTYCGAFVLGAMDGNGRMLWARLGEHYESIDIGQVLPEAAGNQIVVDIDKAGWGESPLLVLDEDGQVVSQFETNRSRQHDLVAWRAGASEDIVVGGQTVYTGGGEPVAQLAMEPTDRPRAAFAFDLTGDGRKDLLGSTWYGTAAYLYRNPGEATPVADLPLGSGLNFTLY